jgi:subtilisin family serine protease
MEEVQALAETADCTIRKRMEFTEREYLLEVLGTDAEAVFAAVEKLSQASEVEWACPNTAYRPRRPLRVIAANSTPAQEPRIGAAGEDDPRTGVFPNDPYFPKQWHLCNTGQSGGTPGADIRALEAWEISTGDPGITVAVVDVGVDTKHPDLLDNLVAGYDFYENDEQPDPSHDVPINLHGTACAGLIAAHGNNQLGVTGVTWDCKIMPIRVSEFLKGETWNEVTEADSATAFRWAAAHGADVFSNSWHLFYSPQPIMHSAIVDVTRPGGLGRGGRGCVFVLLAVGSSGPVTEYPQKYPEVIVVGATDHKDVHCSYSSYGPQLDIVTPSAPSYSGSVQAWVWTTDISGIAGENGGGSYPDAWDYTLFTGTSAACPVAAGVAALILSVEPNLTGDEVRHFLERSAKDLGDPGRDDYYGWGRVDARAALDFVLAKRADLNNDWVVDEEDRAILVKAMETEDLSADIAPAKKRDGKVDQQDLDLLDQYLGTAIPELGLIARWKLDETTGGIAYDSVGKNNAVVVGLAGWQPQGGKVGGALQLSGVTDFAMTGFVRNPAQGPFSAFVWIKGGGPEQVILSQAQGANWLMAAADGTLATEVKESGRNGKPLLSPTVITDGNWHRVGLAWDGTNRVLYVDGVEAARDTQGALTSSTGGLHLGGSSTAAPGTLWRGLIDDVRIYDRAVKP